MATYNGNSIYLRVNNVNVESLWREMDIKVSIDKEDTSAGAGITHKKNAAKLQELTAKLTIVYDTDSAPTDISNIYALSQDHISAIVYGPEGNTTGKPKDDRDWLVTNIGGASTSYDKKLVMFEVDLVSTGEPRSNHYDGDTF